MDVSVKEGDVLGGTYRVERVLGAGGMAVVVAAIHMFEPERVAIKILYRKAAKSKEVLKRFEREQLMIRRMQTEHVSRLLGAGMFKDSPYMVMELLKGQDLADMLKSRGALTIEETCAYIIQACDAVAEAHALGIVHRDLKPGNLFLTHRPDGSPCIKVLDFGIAKFSDPNRNPDESTLTKTTAVFGSPFYMSPEQMVSARGVNASTDIWSLGVVLHELLTKTLPFAEKSPEKICARVLNGSPTPLRELKPDYPAGLEAIILRCLQRKPADRYKNVTDLALSLSPFAPPWAQAPLARIVAVLPPVEMNLEVVAALPPARVELPSIIPEEPESPTVYLPQKGSSGLLKRALLGLFVVGVFASGLFLGVRLGKGSATSPPATQVSASVSASAPAAASAPAEDAASPLAEVPVEMDLDEASPTRKQSERKRTPKDAGGSGLDLAGLQAQYESSLTQSEAGATSKPPASSPTSTTSSTGSPSPVKSSSPRSTSGTPTSASTTTSSPASS